MIVYLEGVFLAWLPLLALTFVLRRHGKVEWPLITGLAQPDVRCMDKRTPNHGWQLPGGAYALGLPIIWTSLFLIARNMGWQNLAPLLAAIALYQFFFSSPLVVVGLAKTFFHGLLGDEAEIRLELHQKICKAVAITDPLALVLMIIGLTQPGRDIFDDAFDTVTALHWIDVLPFLILGTVAGNLGRLIRKLLIRASPWLTLRPSYSELNGLH